MGPEGELVLRVAWDGQAVSAVDVASTRPDVAARLLPGRAPDEVAAIVPRLFSICADSQGAAARLALGAAAGGRSDAVDAVATLRDEAVREYAFRVLLDWPRSVGEPEDAQTLRELQATRTATPEARDRIALAVFGQPAARWQTLATLGALDRWLERGETTAARLLATVRFGDGGFGQSETALLPSPDNAQAARLASAMEADDGFCRQPVWQGAPAETGALARRAGDPLIGEIRARFGNAVLARLAARLRELAGLLAGTITLRAGAAALGAGRGLAWVENARGLLVHVATVVDGRVARYRILAPTEWNFHPQGALAGGLRGTRYASEADLRHRAALLVQSLDPCVACRIELAHA
jgi:hypothetical protein